MTLNSFKNSVFIIFVVGLCLVTACGGKTEVKEIQPTTEENIAVLSPTNTPAGPAGYGDALLNPTGTISANNLDKIKLVARYGDGTPQAATISNDGRLLAVSTAFEIHIYDTDNYAQLKVIETNRQANNLAFSPDGKSLFGTVIENASSSPEVFSIQWNLTDGKQMNREAGFALFNTPGFQGILEDGNGNVLSTNERFSAFYKMPEDSTTPYTFIIEDHQTEQKIIELPDSWSAPIAYAFSLDSTRVAVTTDNIVSVYSLPEGMKKWKAIHPGIQISKVRFSPDQSRIITLGVNELCVWNVTNGAKVFCRGNDEDSYFDFWFSGDGKELIVHRKTTIDTLDLENGKEINQFQLGSENFRDIVTNADASILYLINSDGISLITKNPLLTISGIDQMRGALFTRDGNRIVTYTPQEIRVFSFSSGQELAKISTPAERVILSDDDSTLAAAAPDGSVNVFNLTDGSQKTALAGNGSAVTLLKFLQSGTRLAIGSEESTSIWDIASGNKVYDLPGLTSQCLDLFEQQNFLYTFSKDAVIREWSFQDGAPTENISTPYFKDPTTLNQAQFSPDFLELVSLQGGKIYDMEIRYGTEYKSPDVKNVSVFTVSTDNKKMAAVVPDGVRIFDTFSNFRYADPESEKFLLEGAFNCAALSDTGKYLAVCLGSSVQAYLVAGAKEINSDFSNIEQIHLSKNGKFAAFAEGNVLTIANLEDGSIITRSNLTSGNQSFGEDENILYYTDNEALFKWDLQKNTVVDLGLPASQFSISALGQTIGLYKWQGVGIINIANQAFKQLNVPVSYPDRIALSPDGSSLFTIEYQHNEVKIWDTATGEQTGSLVPVGDTARNNFDAIVPSLDGKTLVEYENLGGYQAIVWDLVEKKPKILSSDKLITTLCFSGDGSIIVTGQIDGSVSFYDTQTLKLIKNLPLGTQRIVSISISADNRYLSFNDIGGRAYLYAAVEP